ncbi:GNAT family N-acetyltransferase [Halopseudomonas sabulinigri]|uniref:N-acetyltransferase domain-containing protein n=1 Tax=Halopseudomonas sabulinigri TaxID=472181 RepID=A0ABP9ZPW6_9GAMM
MNIRYMKRNDLAGAVQVHQQAFGRQAQSPYWIEVTLEAFPRFLCFVAEEGAQILGYLIWAQQRGYRDEASLELDQIAVLPEFLSEQVARRLIEESMPHVSAQLASQGICAKHINISLRDDEHLHRPYQAALDIEVTTAISELYRIDKVMMAAKEMERRAETAD